MVYLFVGRGWVWGWVWCWGETAHQGKRVGVPRAAFGLEVNVEVATYAIGRGYGREAELHL